jgi:hypothetical protein
MFRWIAKRISLKISLTLFLVLALIMAVATTSLARSIPCNHGSMSCVAPNRGSSRSSSIRDASNAR